MSILKVRSAMQLPKTLKASGKSCQGIYSAILLPPDPVLHTPTHLKNAGNIMKQEHVPGLRHLEALIVGGVGGDTLG